MNDYLFIVGCIRDDVLQIIYALVSWCHVSLYVTRTLGGQNLIEINLLAVSGLAKLEGEMIDCDYDEISKDICTKYQLTGIVVHSGQASGGHYYSYILHR